MSSSCNIKDGYVNKDANIESKIERVNSHFHMGCFLPKI